MNYKILFKSLKFAFLPTFSVLLLLFFAFFSITETLNFIGSTNWFAVTLRIVLFVAEIALVYHMYQEYMQEEILSSTIKDPDVIINNEKISSLPRSANDYMYEVFPGDNYSSNVLYKVFKTGDSNVKVIQRIVKN